MAYPRYTRSRWNAVPSVRDVSNTDGQVVRKAEIRPAVFLARTTTLQFRTGVVSRGFGPIRGGKHTRRPEYYPESPAESQCLCKVAGSERCPVAGHARNRDIPAPECWGAVEHPSGARLVKSPRVSER